MTFEMLKLASVGPEMLLLAGVCAILMVDVFKSSGEKKALVYWLSLLVLLMAGGMTFFSFGKNIGTALNGHFIKDTLGDVLKLFIYLTTFITFVYSRDYLQTRGLLKGEFFVLGLFAVLGMLVMVSAGSFLMLFLGLELLSLPLYAMVAFDCNSTVSSEAAMKYFVMGAVASGMLLYGMSMLYGATGTLDLLKASEAVRQILIGNEEGKQTVLIFGTIFIIAGISFKLGAVPFHMWIPDVYQGAPTAVTLFLGAAPKLAAFALLVRVLIGALAPLVDQWQQMLGILAILSMALGNISAISQTNLKRMLGYSTIAHVGFLLLGVLAGNPEGYSAALFYVITYALMALGSFGMIMLLSGVAFESDRIEDFKGLNERYPWFAAIMAILMFSMAGIPPFLGFWAKWGVLRAVINVDQIWIAIIAVITSIIGAWYYLRIIWYMYFEKPINNITVVPSIEMGILIITNGLALLYLGIFPTNLINLCLSVWGLK